MNTDVITRWDSAYFLLARAAYLRKAIDLFFNDEEDPLDDFQLTDRKWEMSELLITILLPFKKASTVLQSTSRPSVDEVFWTYEALFNKINMPKSTLALSQYNESDIPTVLENPDRIGESGLPCNKPQHFPVLSMKDDNPIYTFRVPAVEASDYPKGTGNNLPKVLQVSTSLPHLHQR
jgi:hypothetical protein